MPSFPCGRSGRGYWCHFLGFHPIAFLPPPGSSEMMSDVQPRSLHDAAAYTSIPLPHCAQAGGQREACRLIGEVNVCSRTHASNSRSLKNHQTRASRIPQNIAPRHRCHSRALFREGWRHTGSSSSPGNTHTLSGSHPPLDVPAVNRVPPVCDACPSHSVNTKLRCLPHARPLVRTRRGAVRGCAPLTLCVVVGIGRHF